MHADMMLKGLIVLAPLLAGAVPAAGVAADRDTKEVPRIRVDPGHPWRPPFGLDRVGQPLVVIVEIASERKPAQHYVLLGRLDGKDIARHDVNLPDKPPYTDRVTFDTVPAELVLLARKGTEGAYKEVARQAVERTEFEAQAEARPDKVINPVDLGTILVPFDWLLLAGGQGARVDVAAISRTRDMTAARVTAWFDSAPDSKVVGNLDLPKGRRAQVSVPLAAPPSTLERDTLHVTITGADAKELWRKDVRTMLVPKPPQWPAFGATETRLRYDAPISVRHAETGTWSSMPYEGAWDARLKDVVVSLPNGSRFVFWRGSSYVPFWAGRCNTALSYEWAETGPLPDGFVDSVEPLMDKELRYGRVEIVQSTAAVVQVRWSYQSTDFNYKIWGDSAAEDFTFYPDGFGTRVLTLKSAPGSDYEVSEFIILTPQAAFPFQVLPPNLVDVVFLDGQKREFTFPFVEGEKAAIRKPRDMAAIYRVRLNRDEPLAAVYFNPNNRDLPLAIFGPFFDRGYLVTPAYWGSHWPLARGKSTGWAIDDRIYLSPAHNSIMSWARSRPTPIQTATIESLDTLGRSRTMTVQRWVWLIGMTDASDARLLEWAHSFAHPPSLEIKGGRYDFDSYVPERRALRVVVEDKAVTITLKPAIRCVNPVFELIGAPRTPIRVTMADRLLEPGQYAWDGRVLWLNANIDGPTPLRLEFGESPR
jgi:hypothetical protein